jgi:hypothetical protein
VPWGSGETTVLNLIAAALEQLGVDVAEDSSRVRHVYCGLDEPLGLRPEHWPPDFALAFGQPSQVVDAAQADTRCAA